MDFDKRKYIYIAIATVLVALVVYTTYTLIRYGHPTEKSQKEYIIEANELHKDSLYEQAVEPYMKALEYNEQQSLVNYNTALNSLKMNYKELQKVFNGEVQKFDTLAMGDAISKLIVAGETETDKGRYSQVCYNMGIFSHMTNNLEPAAEAYKEALRKNPTDEDARYNLAVILYQMKQNQQEQQQNQEDKEQEQKEKEKQQQQQQQPQDEGKEQQEQQNQQNQQQEQDKQDEEREKIEQMLKALMQDEKEIRKKLEDVEGERINLGIEKNW